MSGQPMVQREKRKEKKKKKKSDRKDQEKERLVTFFFSMRPACSVVQTDSA
jgi:hypothetical protein